MECGNRGYTRYKLAETAGERQWTKGLVQRTSNKTWYVILLCWHFWREHIFPFRNVNIIISDIRFCLKFFELNPLFTASPRQFQRVYTEFNLDFRIIINFWNTLIPWLQPWESDICHCSIHIESSWKCQDWHSFYCHQFLQSVVFF